MAISSAFTSLTWKTVAVPAVGSASISVTRPAFDITPIGTPTQQYIAGVAGATATLDLFFDEGDAPHATMFGDINDGSDSGALVITLESGTTVTGNAFVTSYEITAQAQSVVRATVQFQYTTAAAANAKPVTFA